ncbi:MAG TPA: Crp/Fnr family transcriptional regulator [Flavisolibacter sp.]|nr:Crp/Fnr family transcriptional regulator [Flavisolibacter sp.]
MLTLFQLLNQIQPLNDEIQTYLLRNLKQKRLKPGEVWLKEGQVCLNVAFIEEGLFKSVYTKKGRVYINWFMRENDIMIAVRSFFEQIPTKETIIALEPSLLYYIDFPSYQHLNTYYKAFQAISNSLMALYYEKCQDRTELLRLYRSDRYSEFMRTEKDLVPRLKQKHIASYLGLSEERLSDLRSELYS